MPWHKSPGSFPETLGFIELAAPGGDNLQHLGICMAVPFAMEGLQPLQPPPGPTARNQVLFFFSLAMQQSSTHSFKFSNILIFFFPSQHFQSLALPNPALLRTGPSFSHRGCLEELDETRVCQIKPPKNDTEQQCGVFDYYSKEDSAQKHLVTCQEHQVTYDNSSRNKKLLWARAVVLLLVKAS